MSRPFNCLLICAAFFTSFGAQAADLKTKVSELGLQPHKALYEIRLISAHSGSQILNISGQMFYEWQPSCDAWISNHRFNLLYEYADTPSMRVASDFSTYETFDGKTLNFTSQRKRDSELFEEVRGQAMLEDSGVGQVSFTLPETITEALPPGTIFPMGHSVGVAQAIREGKKIYHSVIFDGSDQEGAVEVNAVIGKAIEKPAKIEPVSGGAVDESLLTGRAHSVHLAFFPLSAAESTSDYEMKMTLYDNGVIDSMEIEYDDFTLSQKLVALEPVADGCNAPRFNR
jgi:hypothetical protein